MPSNTNVLTIPGLWNSGPQHWQTLWEARYPAWQRVEQLNWDRPDKDAWVETLDRAIAAQAAPPVLAAHSLGCCLVAQWVADRGGAGVAGALLVAPSDVEAPGYPEEGRSFASMPLVRLPFPSIVVSSTDDEYVSVERAQFFASQWGSRLVTIGPAGHFNGASGHGAWPEGEALLLELVESVAQHARASVSPRSTNPVEVGRFLDVRQAEFVRSLLAGSDVESYIDQQYTGGIAPHYMLGSGGGVRVYVAADDEVRAKEILQAFESPERDDEPDL